MGMAIDTDEMDDVRARIVKDRKAVHDDKEAVKLPVTEIPTSVYQVTAPTGADAGADFVQAIKDEVNELATWLSKRGTVLRGVIDDFKTIDGAQGTKYARLRQELAMSGENTRDDVDAVTGSDDGELHGEEGGYDKKDDD